MNGDTTALTGTLSAVMPVATATAIAVAEDIVSVPSVTETVAVSRPDTAGAGMNSIWRRNACTVAAVPSMLSVLPSADTVAPAVPQNDPSAGLDRVTTAVRIVPGVAVVSDKEESTISGPLTAAVAGTPDRVMVLSMTRTVVPVMVPAASRTVVVRAVVPATPLASTNSSDCRTLVRSAMVPDAVNTAPFGDTLPSPAAATRRPSDGLPRVTVRVASVAGVSANNCAAENGCFTEGPTSASFCCTPVIRSSGRAAVPRFSRPDSELEGVSVRLDSQSATLLSAFGSVAE